MIENNTGQVHVEFFWKEGYEILVIENNGFGRSRSASMKLNKEELTALIAGLTEYMEEVESWA
jgi:hypothetical protein